MATYSRTEAARRISELSGHIVSESTLRNFWEAEVLHLLAPPLYEEEDINQAVRVARMRAAGVSLQQIRATLAASQQRQEVLAMTREQVMPEVDRRAAALQAKEASLSRSEARTKVFNSDERLYQQYRAAFTRQPTKAAAPATERKLVEVEGNFIRRPSGVLTHGPSRFVEVEVPKPTWRTVPLLDNEGRHINSFHQRIRMLFPTWAAQHGKPCISTAAPLSGIPRDESFWKDYEITAARLDLTPMPSTKEVVPNHEPLRRPR